MRNLKTDAKNFCQDKNGKIVLLQTPNVPIFIWGIATILGKLVTAGRLQTFADVISFAFICIWAWLEIAQGSSNFRRALGVVILFVSICSRVF